MLGRLRPKFLLTALLVISVAAAHAEPFHVKDAQAAIAIAKRVCAKEAAPSSKWTAELDSAGLFWSVWATSEQSTWTVPTIPVYSSYPYLCMQAGDLYTILPVGKTQHELDCMHLLLPDCPDQKRTKSPRQR
jgi:hypothetical protein